jgi:hypothetical protein
LKWQPHWENIWIKDWWMSLIALKRFLKKLYLLEPWRWSHLSQQHKGPLVEIKITNFHKYRLKFKRNYKFNSSNLHFKIITWKSILMVTFFKTLKFRNRPKSKGWALLLRFNNKGSSNFCIHELGCFLNSYFFYYNEFLWLARHKKILKLWRLPK